MKTYTCTACDNAVESARLPRAWKYADPDGENGLHCGDCWKRKYMMRSIVIPVATAVNLEWREFTALAKRLWGLSTALANWSAQELAKHDITRQPEMERLPKKPACYLYGVFKAGYGARDEWAGAKQAANTIMRTVEQKYNAKRYETLWKQECAHPSYRYPYPYPVERDGWQPSYGPDREPLVSLVVPGIEGRLILRLRAGHDFKYKAKRFAMLVNGQAVRTELSLYRTRANTGDHRPGHTDRRDGGGQRVSYRYVVRMAAWIPREHAEAEGGVTLAVRTGKRALLIASLPGSERPWVLKENQIRRQIQMHRWHLNNLADDTKAERRRPRRNKVAIRDRYDALCARQHNRLDAFTWKCAAWLAAYAFRNGVDAVVYSDDDRRYIPDGEFPWAQLRERIKGKLDEKGIGFALATAEAVEDNGNEPNGEGDGNG